MTTELLRSYSDAALRNADELLIEASLLLDHGHDARAYFLSVACIEETGKALFAFDAQNRNFCDPAVCTKLKVSMENHAHKINYALGTWALSSEEPREALKVALNLISDLKHGREPSMYTDLRANPDRVQTPRGVVSAIAARGCARLAEKALAYAHRHVTEKTPSQFTTAQDRLFAIKTGKFQEMLKSQDFWWYYISRLEAGQQEFAEVVIAYERDHIKHGKLFCAE